jgi:hypothetical protein
MINNDWDEKLKLIWESNGFNNFLKSIYEEYDKKTIFPPKDYIFNALKLTLSFIFFTSFKQLYHKKLLFYNKNVSLYTLNYIFIPLVFSLVCSNTLFI